MAGEIIAVKQIEVPPDGIARCYWWPHLEHDLGFPTDQPLNPDGWQLRTVDRGIFYGSGTAPAGRTQRLASRADDAPPLHDQLSALHDAHHAVMRVRPVGVR